jgi:hypothetical protein
MKGGTPGQQGQGLVEYAVILVLVVIGVVISLMSFSITIGNVLYNPIIEQFDKGPLLGIIAQRAGYGNGNDVIVTITVSGTTSVTVTDSQSGQTVSTACTGTCQVTLIGVGHEHGTVTVTGGIDTGTARYPPQPH